TMTKVQALFIDPQNDFCDPENGSLYVPGADQDMCRLSRMLDRIAHKIDDVHVTMDSHHPIDIAHPIFWINDQGEHPAPFTSITAADVESGAWTTTLPAARTRSLHYLKTLEQKGRYPHVIWPPHCLIGSHGHGVNPVLFDALCRWESKRFGMVDYVTKGSNLWTEHFSAIQAEVPDPMDPNTQVNTHLIERLAEADIILLAGEAGSHCLANTVRDIANNFSDPAFIQKMVLLTDATSPVPGFNQYQDDFIRDLTQRGMKTSTTETIFA
ncbi:MAG: hypothetical protein VX278_11705, partial [Myxococcota bacterium]|nr:hypothetical protein [Myxococcota bacterium]